MKNSILKGSILAYTIFVLTATLVLFILSDQVENFASTEKNEMTELGKMELPSGTRYKTIEYNEKVSVEEIFDITSKQTKGLKIETINFDSIKVGLTNITVIFKKNGVTSQGLVHLTVTDTEKPRITLEDSTIFIGEEFDPLNQVTAQDNVDGDLSSKINVSGIVDSSNEGTYKIEYTVVDSSNNHTSKTRAINVIADPKADTPIMNVQLAIKEQNKEDDSSTELDEQTKDAALPNQETTPALDEALTNPVSSEDEPNILLINGTRIPYQNGGEGSGQAIIDSNPSGSASTWGGVPIQSGDDGANTHFIGHNPGVFSVLFSVGVGQSISVNDSNGKTTTYIINNILHLDDFGHDLTTGIDYWEQTVGTAGGERITLQTCISDTENLMVLASK